MARYPVTYNATTGHYVSTSIPDGELISGVEIRRTIPAGYASETPFTAFGEVKVRPTNVTAAVNLTGASTADPEFIVLQNGPNGGFTQSGGTDTTGTHRTNAVVAAIITTA